jgi:hypothetical protein
MSSKSNNQGRAFEYACLKALHKEISKVRPVSIKQNSSYDATKKAWDTLSKTQQATYKISALAGISPILELEPLLTERKEDEMVLSIQSDEKGIKGDVRDILIMRREIDWEIGLSIKHNHAAVKHSRLSKSLDFGKSWYGKECSEEYWNDVEPIFDFLEKEKNKRTKWSELEEKEDMIYLPLLKAFKKEVKKQSAKYPNEVPRLMSEYLLGVGDQDYYKVIAKRSSKISRVETYNVKGTLNKQLSNQDKSKGLPVSQLPTQFLGLEHKENSKNTLELYMDGGWQFSLRIHNASTTVEPSLKFDINLINMPSSIITIERSWKKPEK